MAISALLYPIFLLIYLINNVQFVSNIPLPQKENDVVLSAYIRHYEPAIYDPDKIQRQQKRLRRSTGSSRVAPEPLRINITAPHRIFKLVLYPETNLFAPDVVFETDDSRSLQFDPGKIYQGTLEDDPSAVVHGLITSSGLFDGTVTTRSNRYYIEPSSRYLSGPLATATYHTVVYSEDDVIKPTRERCASEELRKQGKESLHQDGTRRKKEAQREDRGFVTRRRKNEMKRKEEEEKRRIEQETLEAKAKEVETEEDAAKIKYEKELREEEMRRKEVEILREKEEEARKAEEKLREEELARRKKVDILREKEEEARKEELLRRKEVESLRQKEADVLREKYEAEIREEELRRKEVDILVQKEEEARKEEELRRIEVEILRLIEENVRKEELAKRKNVNVDVRKEEKARREEDIRRKEEEVLRLKEEKARSEEEFRRKEVDILRLKEEQARKEEEKAREAESERRKEVEVLRLEEEKARNEEEFRRKEVDLLVLREQEGRKKEEKAREEELEMRKEVDTLRAKEEDARKDIDVVRLKEEKERREEDFRRKELASLRRKEAEIQKEDGGDDGGEKKVVDLVEGGRRRRPGGTSGGEKKKLEMGSGLRTHRQTGPYSMSRTMRDENQDIDTILRVEAPNRTIISISKPGLKMNSTHRNILVNSRPAEYDESLDQFDSFFNRNPKFSIIDAKKTTCMLYLQADHLFFEKYGTEESCIEVMTRHVQRVNSIYKNTDFNQDGSPDNITFMIKRIKVHTHESVSNNPGYRFQGNYGVEKFLEIFSEEDYDAFCLAYMFTYRDFEMGTLGLAWTGDLKNAGGVCEKNGHYRGSMKSLNTGIVTLLNYGKHVPPAVSHVTLAHEIGHNFGSPHDPEICTPGGDDGNYIMFARATSGDKKNNNKFSQCSLNSINPVLNTKARSGKGCFIQPQVSLCGNGVVEEGEECDCGWEEDCKDSCCHPQRRYPTLAAKPCTLTPGSDCSPSQGPCCTTECRLKSGDKCRDDNGCRDSSFCSGKQPQCPPSINKPNKTVCNAEFVCYMGECTGSICLAYGLESCQCIPGPGDPLIKACELCCKMPGENQPCLSSFLLNTPPYDVPDMYSKPGSPCNEYNGYCDVYQKCREVDPSGPLATLRRLLLSDESINSAKKWALEHWYYSGLMFLSFLLILVLSVRLFGKESDLKKKGNVTIMHSSTTETVRLPPEDAANVTVHPAVVRSKLPLKKKVRERGKKSRENDPPGKDVSRKIAKKLIDKNLKKNMKPLAKIAEEDPLGKVRNWLLHSHHLTNGLNSLRQSKSSPAGFVAMETSVPTTPNDDVIVAPLITIATEAPPAVLESTEDNSPTTKPKGGEKSNEMEVKLQVVFKPPFNFSVKLRKPNKVDPKKGAANKGDGVGKKIEKSTSNNRLVDCKTVDGNEVATPSEVKAISGKGGKVAKHKLLADKNVPEPVKKRAALLIRADKTLRRSPKHAAAKVAKKSALAASQKVKNRPALASHPTDLARLISQESQNSNQSKEDDQVGVSPEPVYENADVEMPVREKLEKLQKHSRNIEAVVRRQNSGDSQQAASSPSYLDTSEDLIDMSGDAAPGVSKKTNVIPMQEDIRKKHRSKRKKASDPSPNDSNYKLEKRYSMSDVPSAPAGVPKELRHSNCDLASKGLVEQGSKKFGRSGNNSRLRHSSSDVIKNMSERPDDEEPIGVRKSSKRQSSRRDHVDGSDAKKRHSMSELPSKNSGPNSHRNRLPNDCPSNSPNSFTPNLANADSSDRPRGLTETGSKRHSMSDVPSEMHIYENLLDNELIFSTGNQNVRNGTRASLNVSRTSKNHKSFNRPSEERSQRNAGENQNRPNPSGDTKHYPSSFNDRRHSQERAPSSSSLNRSSNQNLSEKSPRHSTVNPSSSERYSSNSALHQSGSNQSSQERGNRSRSLNRSQSSNHVGHSSDSFSRHTQQHSSNTHAQSPTYSQGQTSAHGRSPTSTHARHGSSAHASPAILSHSTSFSSVPAPQPLGSRAISSHDLMRFPSLETEANTRLDYLISGKK